MDYESMTLLELKKICKSRGLIISGKKDDVIIRLMENDELNQQPSQSIQSSYAGTMPIQSNSQIISGQNVQRIYLGNKGSTVNAIGTIVIIYGSFRMLMAFAFSIIGIGGLGWALAPIAFVLSFAFIFGGILMLNEYLNGIYFTMVTFLISGLLSIIFAGGDLNPVSISISEDGSMTLFSIMCTTFGMGLVALPLLMSFDELKKGWPPSIERFLSSFGDGTKKNNKIEISCDSCDRNLNVPADYSGKISCPHCGNLMRV